MTENNTAKTTAPAAEKKAPAKAPSSTRPLVNGAGEAVVQTPKAPSTRAKKAAAKPAPAKAPAKAAAAKAKPAPKAAAKKDGKPAPVLATKSGVPHPGTLWRALLDQQGMTRMACAKEMGVAPMTLHRYMEGQGIPTAKVTVAFARVTKQNVKKVWAQVCDYELALVLEQEEAAAK